MPLSGSTSNASDRSTLNIPFKLPLAAGLNQLFASIVLEELARLGVQHICLAPGSRSAPLALAAQTSRLKQHWHFDERGLAFKALGLAKASGKPVVIVTTSGSAVANLLPAVVEAFQTGVPLILLTADRPPELINCAANQAIIQQGIFSNYLAAETNWLPTIEQPIASYLTELDQLLFNAQSQQAPVHINLMLREPLYPGVEQPINPELLRIPARWLNSAQVFTDYLQSYPQLEQSYCNRLVSSFSARKGLIITGDLSTEDSQAALQLSQVFGWPLVADIQSGLKGLPGVLSHSDLLLVNPQSKALLDQAEVLIQLGPRLVCKRLGQWITAKANAGNWHNSLMISRQPQRQDPDHLFHQRWTADVAKACVQLIQAIENQTIKNDGVWLKALQNQQQQLSTKLDDWLDSQQTGPADEMNISRQFLQLAPSAIFVGNSLPVRLAEMVGHGRQTSSQNTCEQLEKIQCQQVFTNRGASGIDGLLASAVGVASALQTTVTKQKFSMLLGDLSLLHDLNSLELLANFDDNFVLVVINNDGGGIFHMLPIPADSTTSTLGRDCFQRPHGRKMQQAAAMFAVDYQPVTELAQFKPVYQQALNSNLPSIIEVFTAPGSAAQQIKQLIKEFS
ncbi:2-succinyl-5-enolpyruvyl-6-hydroxy-3-cyclohexene-1-carboxylic-acid synthase [Pelagibaculum spongiae]|uniref:2-succinyl-5-enolpyruvyl-6-hydroxy-3- cyclohexene-1-carboxylic-acid synthase n=1 Tax=Pelagibaculum spongiae TaxID=2080658 RepID=UPI001314693D|nr:2-succinyl-5-enolpyruvyl-6-hydroxy-3-cyclohexene-1-carboxylic-acid synthase [Pelagibaculum spongiae]